MTYSISVKVQGSDSIADMVALRVGMSNRRAGTGSPVLPI